MTLNHRDRAEVRVLGGAACGAHGVIAAIPPIPGLDGGAIPCTGLEGDWPYVWLDAKRPAADGGRQDF